MKSNIDWIMAGRKMVRRIPIYTLVAALLLAALGGCIGPSRDASQRILGRWQRVGEATLGDPLGSLASEHVEFREDGQLITLLFDEGPDRFWMVRTGRYSFPKSGQIQIQGYCWHSWERYDCSGEYTFSLTGDRLRITEDERANSQVEYRRIGALSQDLPPTLAPPFPSPTPG